MNVKINNEEGGFIDFILPIKKMEVTDKERLLTLEGSFEGEEVGV